MRVELCSSESAILISVAKFCDFPAELGYFNTFKASSLFLLHGLKQNLCKEVLTPWNAILEKF